VAQHPEAEAEPRRLVEEPVEPLARLLLAARPVADVPHHLGVGVQRDDPWVVRRRERFEEERRRLETLHGGLRYPRRLRLFPGLANSILQKAIVARTGGSRVARILATIARVLAS